MKLLLEFTEQLCDLLCADVPLKYGLLEIAHVRGQKRRISGFAYELYFAMEAGADFGTALSRAEEISVPDWYWTFASSSSEAGELKNVLFYLKGVLEERERNFAEICNSLIYPILVIGMTLFCGIGTVIFLPDFFGQMDFKVYREDSYSALIYGFWWLSGCGFFLLLILKKLFGDEQFSLFMRAFSFLMESGVNVVRALECCVPLVEKNKKLCGALMDTRQFILDGQCCGWAFCEGFEMNGIKKVGKLLNLNLNVCGEKSIGLVFRRTALILEENRKKKKKRFMEILPSVLIVIAAVYMGLILKGTVLPLILNDGGIL